mmetsp:Transcript_22390/g.46085  ORF Transcript_22390/g.46085 Transcript_22390/m.46085 type:complete len:513 (+) Transcript_22390:602-2140(+)
MSSRQQNNGQQQSHPVAQMIIESLTRCFNPLNSDVTCGYRRSDAGISPIRGVRRGEDNLRPESRAGSHSSSTPSKNNRANTAFSSPTCARDRLELNSAEWNDVFSSSNSKNKKFSSTSRKVSSSSSSEGNHADVVANAKRAAIRRRSSNKNLSIDPKTLEVRSMKRKLEIFRCRGDDNGSVGNDSHSSYSNDDPASSSRRPPVSKARVEEDSSDDEEIRNLMAKRRFACGFGMRGDDSGNPTSKLCEPLGYNTEGPMSSFARFFNITPPPMSYGLCFATPVRSYAPDDFGNLSDDKLTADEFIQRHGGVQIGRVARSNHDTPELETSIDGSVSEGFVEDETITSTLYFDQKYSHVVQTRPPMPLFHSQIIQCSESKTDELTRMIEERKLGGSLQGKSSNVSYGSQSPPKVITPKNTKRRDTSGVFSKTTPPKPTCCPRSNSPTGNDYTGKRFTMGNSAPPSPMRITGWSSSVSTQSAENSPGIHSNASSQISSKVVRKMRDPDILYSTAAEI